MIAALALAMALVAQQPANDSILEQRTREVASGLRCPVCQGLSIEDSPTDLSVQMKDLVREQLRAGKSPDEVRAYFVSKYGEWILLEPRARGANLLVYVLPIGMVVGGAIFIAIMVRKWSRAPRRPVSVMDEEEAIL